jgi:hypothetical protein
MKSLLQHIRERFSRLQCRTVDVNEPSGAEQESPAFAVNVQFSGIQEVGIR